MIRLLVMFCLILGFSYAKPMVSVSILPQHYFVEKIAGDTVEVNVMVQPGHSPHTYEPRPSQMVALEKSALYFAIGVNFENAWIPRFKSANPALVVVETDHDVPKQPIADHDHEEEEHGHDHAHKDDHADKHEDEHAGYSLDPHIWLDPVLVKIQANAIANALISAFPQHAALYQGNLRAFEAELDALDAQIRTKLTGLTHRKFMIFHPNMGYLASRYGLEQVAIEIEGKEPKPAALAALIKEAKHEHVHVIFVAPQFSTKSAQVIAKEIGGSVVPLNALSKEWESELLKSVDALAAGLR
ncbi:MAG: zinc ABC transporter substrate-binding protein [Campylobacterales bacterium]|nr:zinc ABC transporter substrate-binding protein [Campylobacterales bacterium]